MRNSTMRTGLLAAAFGTFGAVAARAQDTLQNLEIIGAPVDRGLGFQPAATELASDLQWLDGMLNYIIGAICLFVAALIVWIIVRYNQRANKNPATFTHHSLIEVIWTVIPIVILIFIGAFSLPVLFKQQTIPEGDIVIKTTGHQWYWTYEYTDHEFEFDSYMLGHPSTLGDEDDAVTPFVLDEHMVALLERSGYSKREFLLATDTAMVVPTGKTVVVQVTADDVIHSWTIPAFGVKQDAVPGRLAQLWFEVEEGKEGVYFGQCSELCGKDHAYMPITVKAVTQEQYDAWLDGAIEEYAGKPRDLTVASN